MPPAQDRERNNDARGLPPGITTKCGRMKRWRCRLRRASYTVQRLSAAKVSDAQYSRHAGAAWCDAASTLRCKSGTNNARGSGIASASCGRTSLYSGGSLEVVVALADLELAASPPSCFSVAMHALVPPVLLRMPRLNRSGTIPN